MKTPLSLPVIQQARERIASGLRVTPCEFSQRLSEITGMSIWLKREYEQVTGSFKERGARNALLSLPPDAQAKGVVAASAGNHALGLSLHGRHLGVPVTVVMPVHAPKVKVERCRDLGADVVMYGRTFDEAAEFAEKISQSAGKRWVHPFDDWAVIAGQGTLGLEIVEQTERSDVVILPVGGGGLIAGAALALKALRPSTRIVAVEPAHAPSYSVASSEHRPVNVPVSATLADGLAVSRVGHYTFAASRHLVDDVVTVTEDEIAQALLFLAEEEGLVVEGAAATTLAACLNPKFSYLRGQSVVLPLTGRNIDPIAHKRALWRARSAREFEAEIARSPRRRVG
jgi:threonine dehydratase